MAATVSTTSHRIAPVECDACGEPGRVDLTHPSLRPACRNCGRMLWSTAVQKMAVDFGCAPQTTIPCLLGHDLPSVLGELAAAAADANGWTSQQRGELADALLRREMLGSTGLGRGVAVPHASVDWIDRRATVLAYAALPLEFHALDGRPVHTLFLVVSPKHDRPSHVRYMECVVRLLRSIVQ